MFKWQIIQKSKAQSVVTILKSNTVTLKCFEKWPNRDITIILSCLVLKKHMEITKKAESVKRTECIFLTKIKQLILQLPAVRKQDATVCACVHKRRFCAQIKRPFSRRRRVHL